MIEINSSLVKQPMPLPEMLTRFQELLVAKLQHNPGGTYSLAQVQDSFKSAQDSLLPSYLAQDAMVYLISFPLMSMAASGKFGKFVFVNWGGKTYLRRYTKPSNPRTEPQQQQRNYLRVAVAHYQQETTETRAFWKERATDIEGKSGYSLYVSAVIKLLQQDIDPPIGFRGLTI